MIQRFQTAITLYSGKSSFALALKNTKHIDCTPSEYKGSTANKRVTLLGPTDDPGQRSGAEGSASDGGGDTVPAHKIITLGRRRIRARMLRTNKVALQTAQQKQTKGCIFSAIFTIKLTLQFLIQLSKTVNSARPYLINAELMAYFLIPVGNELVVIYFT